jgi:DNA-binding NtrC family response regulator
MTEPRQILIVEDEHALGQALAVVVRRAGHLPTVLASGAAALKALEQAQWALLILDIGLPDMSGLQVLEQLRGRASALPVLVITAHATLDHAIRAQKNGATLYLTKPLDLAQLEAALQSLIRSAERQVPQPLEAAPPKATATLIGSAPCLQPVFVGIARACASRVPTLITGPSGVGKSLAAGIIHAHSGCSGGLQTVDCRLVTDGQSLLSVLRQQEGGGSVVLDEVTALSPAAQTALAAWLSELPSAAPRLLATSRLEPTKPAEGSPTPWQAELFYALSASRIALPPLRERSGDIAALSAFFLTLNRSGSQLTTPVLAALQQYDWPGNVRELRHALDYALGLSADGRLFVSHLPPHIASCAPDPLRPAVSTELEALLGRWLAEQQGETYDQLLDTVERTLLRQLLERFQGKTTHLASEMGFNRATLRQKLRRLGLQSDDPAS